MSQQRVIGLVPSVRFDLVERLIESVNNSAKRFPIIVLAQGYTEEQKQILAETAPDNFTFVHIEKAKKPIGHFRSELFKLAGAADFYYLFDDDFVFGENGMADVLAIADAVKDNPFVGAIYINENYDRFSIGSPYTCLNSSAGYPLYHCMEIAHLGMRSGIFVRASAFHDAIGILNPVVSIYEEPYIATLLFIKGYDILKAEADIIHLYDVNSYGNEMIHMHLQLSEQGKKVAPNGGISGIDLLWDEGLGSTSEIGVNYLSEKARTLHYNNRLKIAERQGFDASYLVNIPNKIELDGKKLIFAEDANLLHRDEDGFIVLDCTREFEEPDLQLLPAKLYKTYSDEDKYFARNSNIILGEFSRLFSLE